MNDSLKPTKLILIRHAMVDRVGPRTSWALSAEGRDASVDLAERLIPYEIDLLVSSVETKAQQTAALIANELGIEWHTAENLHEHARETVGLMPRDAFLASVERFFSHPNELVFGEERADQALARFSAAVDAVREANPGRTLGIVSHGTVMSLYVNKIDGRPIFPFWSSLRLPDYVALDISP